MSRVEVPISDENNLVGAVEAMRAWLDDAKFTPSGFGYSLSSPRILFWADFAVESEAAAFAEAFDGAIVNSPPR